MSLSPHQETAEAIRVLVAAWESLPSGFTVERAYSVSHYINGWADATPGRIVVLVSGIESERIGATNQDEPAISVVYLRKLVDSDLATVDVGDFQTDQLRTFLTTDAFKKLRLQSGAMSANRVNTSMPTPYAANEIRENLVFAAVISTTYRILRQTA